MPRHRHTRGYVAILLEGGYYETGDRGRYAVRPGDALVHSQFEAHQNDSAASGARILNLPIAPGLAQAGLFEVLDPDFLVRLAERDFAEAAEVFSETARQQDRAEADWPDLLAAELRGLAPLRLSEWARRHGLAAETVSSGFARAFGVTPHLYRAEARARKAVAAIQSGAHSLAAIAVDLGFSDQAHMTRAVHSLTGGSPKQLWKLNA
ncbi:MAG: helix-turn-helix domain-containing protein [Sphingomicrobium sp.]